jgi:GxxExxY protein
MTPYSSHSRKAHINALSKKILDAAMRVHTELGPGFLESVYEACLAYELRNSGVEVECQVPQPIRYRHINLDVGYRVDMVVEKAIIVELKAVEKIQPFHMAQVLSYLKMSGLNLGLLINFNVVSLKDGIQRLVYRF